MKAIAVLMLCLSLGLPAHADVVTRSRLIERILEAQGTKQMFETQLNQSRASAEEYGQRIYAQMASELGISDPEVNGRLKAALGRYMARCTTLWTAQELVDAWAANYGSELSDKDLRTILAYYTSPTGKKDMAASQRTMMGFSQMMSTESEKRMAASINALIADLKAAIGQ